MFMSRPGEAAVWRGMSWRMASGSLARWTAFAVLSCAPPSVIASAAGVPPQPVAPSAVAAPVPLARLGLTVEALDPAIAERVHVPPSTQGLVVTSLAFKGPAAAAGIRIGDIVQAIDGHSLAGSKGVRTLADHRGAAQLTVLRAGVTSVVPVG